MRRCKEEGHAHSGGTRARCRNGRTSWAVLKRGRGHLLPVVHLPQTRSFRPWAEGGGLVGCHLALSGARE